jgi:hypothetical protein
LIKTDEELAALADGTPEPMSIDLDTVLRNVPIDPEYAFLVTHDNALLMGCLASVAKYQESIASPPGRMMWDIVGAVLKRQIQMVSMAEENDHQSSSNTMN